MVTIIEYEDKHHEDFRQLNIVWLEKFGLLESHDVMVLNDPKGTIIKNGGYIFLAEADGKIIGSAGIMKEHDGEYELIKMSVAPEHQGKGISKLLIEKCLEKAADVKAEKVILYSNSQLKRAISLYEKYGFRHVPATNSPFVTADVKMELEF
jgi:putative acetyltransferase